MAKNYSLILLTALLLFCAETSTRAQSLSGVVNDKEGNSLPAVSVLNITRNLSTLTDADGRFQIPAGAKDIIRFSYLGYRTENITMPDDKNVRRTIVLQKQQYTLSEVEVRPDWTPYQLDSMRRRSTYRLTLDREKERSVMSPVSALAENISSKSRQRWRFQKNYTTWENQKFIDTRYTPELVQSLTRLGGDTLAAFMNSYPMPVDYARAATELEIKMWIKYNYRTWIKKPIVIPPDIRKQFINTDTISR